MIKKMYARPDKEIQEQVLTDEICKNTGNIKPVWVTDRDPHKNVKKLIADYPKFDYTKISLARAIAKDLKNWDEGAG